MLELLLELLGRFNLSNGLGVMAGGVTEAEELLAVGELASLLRIPVETA